MHLYDRDGNPVYEVPNKSKGGMRPATLRDAKKLNLVPSVTEILKIMSAPGLEQWKQDQMIQAALTEPRIDGETDGEFIARIKQTGKEHARIAADRGTMIHSEIENAFLLKQTTEIGESVRGYTLNITSVDSWGVERPFSHQLGFGGRVDFWGDPPCVVDFKTKEKLSKKNDWPEHIMQLAAYRFGLCLPEDARLINVYVSWDGDIVHKEWTSEDGEHGLDGFLRCLNLWKWAKNYNPSF